MFCLLVVVVKLSLLAKWLARKTHLRKPNRGEGIISIKPRPKRAYDCDVLYSFIMFSRPNVIYFLLLWHDIAYLCWKCRKTSTNKLKSCDLFACFQATSRRDRAHQRFPVTCCDPSNFRFRSLSWTVPCGEWNWRDVDAVPLTLNDLDLSATRDADAYWRNCERNNRSKRVQVSVCDCTARDVIAL